MRRRFDPLAALAPFVGLVILALGALYIVQRDETWESTASVILVPDPAKQADRTVLLEAFDTSLTLGTHVELLSSRALEESAGAPLDSVEARAVPETRVVEITMTGEQGEVESDLATLIEVGTVRAETLGDLWTLETLTEPSTPTAAGPPTPALIAGTIFLALLGAVATFAAIARLPASRPGAGEAHVPAERGNGSVPYKTGPMDRTPKRVPNRR
jgi:hypothetical protein